MMNKNDFIKQLFTESKKWVTQGLFTDKQTGKLKDFYKEDLVKYPNTKKKNLNNLTFIKVNSIIAILLLVFATAMFFSGSWDTMNAFSKVFVMFLGLGIFGSSAYLFIKRKDLSMGFILLWITSLIFGVTLIVLNKMLDIYMPYYAVFFFRFLCIIPFVLIFRFKYFLIFALLLLNISSLLFVYYFYASSFTILGLLSLIITGAILINFKRMYRVFLTQEQYLENTGYYNMLYVFGVGEFLLAYVILSQKIILGKILTESTYASFLFLSFLPLLILVSTIVIYYFRKKRKFENGELLGVKPNTKRDVKTQIMAYIKNERCMLLVDVSLIVLVFSIVGPINAVLSRNGYLLVINVFFLLITAYFFYEGILLKIPRVTTLSVIAFFVYFILKYFTLFYDTVNGVFLFVGGGLVFVAVGFLVEKNRQMIIEYVTKKVKDGSSLYLK